MIDIDLLQVLKSRENFTKYRKFIKDHALAEDTQTILKDIGVYFDTYTSDNHIDWPKFSTWFRLVRHPGLKEEKYKIYQKVFDKLQHDSGGQVAADVVKHYVTLDYVTRILDIGNKIVDGDTHADLSVVGDLIDEYLKEIDAPDTEHKPVSTNLSDLLNACVRAEGVEWRLNELNVSVGPVHYGDLIIVGARPETGKTSFVTSEITYWASQIKDDRPIIILNNEERGDKIQLRAFQSATNKTVNELVADEAASMAEYESAVGGLERIKVIDVHGGTTRDIERIVKDNNPCVLVFNVLYKVGGIKDAQNDADRITKLAEWARTIGIRNNCIVILVVQADGSAEGQKWIHKDQLYGSKTGLQGEADVIVTIGATHDPSSMNTRYIHVPKNKLPGGPKSVATQKHGYFEVAFDGERGRYESGAGYKSI